MDGASILAQSLKGQGVQYMFGIVGRPVTNIAMMAQSVGIQYINCRNEQSASYAAGAVGYLTGIPGVCLCVSGPGVVHGLAGAANAWANCWPMILIGGASEIRDAERGAFQEAPQIETVRPYTKLACRAGSCAVIPALVEKLVRVCTYGRPGACYLDLASEIIYGTAQASEIIFPPRCPPPPRMFADKAEVERAIRLLSDAKRPLVIVGKGAAYARAEREVQRFIEQTGLPFLATPMGKGVVPDDHPQCVAAARSLALKSADVVLLIGARLNWMLHFGASPRWGEGVKFIHVELFPEELHSSVRAEVALVGDAVSVVNQLLSAATAAVPSWRATAGNFQSKSPWWCKLDQKVSDNKAINARLTADDRHPLTYYRAIQAVFANLPRDAVIVSEGANTMDIGRTILDNYFPRRRLDAGTWGTMGVGFGFAIAAALVYPNSRVVALEGDSAFGFSAMEMETITRYNLPITVVIINNNGISMGVPSLEPFPAPPFFAYTPSARYEKIADTFGGKGYFAIKYEEIDTAMKAAMKSEGASIINVCIDPSATRKPQEHPFELHPTSKL